MFLNFHKKKTSKLSNMLITTWFLFTANHLVSNIIALFLFQDSLKFQIITT